MFETRRRRVGQAQGGADDPKQEPGAPEEGEVTGLSPTGPNPVPGAGQAGGVSTRRTSYATVSHSAPQPFVNRLTYMMVMESANQLWTTQSKCLFTCTYSLVPLSSGPFSQ